ncbi:MAG: hypothetical protein ACI8QZ_003601 [Chlamydiales bacterium]|jgi:hypothetical protein
MRPPFHLAALVALLISVGCVSTADALRGSSGLIRDETPVAYRIAVAEFEVAESIPQATEENKWYLSTRNGKALQALLVDALRAQRTGSEIVALDGDPRATGVNESVDLVLVPHLRSATFAYEGASGRVWASSALWLFTWIGSLWAEDARYTVDMRLECELIDPHAQDEYVQRLVVQSGDVELPYWDRNEAWSTGFFMTMVFPPFWARDEATIVSPSLTAAALEQLAARIKRYLVENHTAQVPAARYADIRFHSPASDGAPAASADLSCTIRTREGVERLLLYCNGQNMRLTDLQAVSNVPSLEAQLQPRGTFEFDFSAQGIALQPGPNFIRLWLQLGSGDVTTRSIVVQGS